MKVVPGLEVQSRTGMQVCLAAKPIGNALVPVISNRTVCQVCNPEAIPTHHDYSISHFPDITSFYPPIRPRCSGRKIVGTFRASNLKDIRSTFSRAILGSSDARLLMPPDQRSSGRVFFAQLPQLQQVVQHGRNFWVVR